MKKALPIGVSDFGDMITGNGYYADKTLMIAEWLQTMNGNVTLITRPRRFGKTLNMTMLREFFDITKDSGELFKGLRISQTAYMQELNSRPVIFLSFKDCKGGEERVLTCVYNQLFTLYDKYSFAVNGDSEMKQKKWKLLARLFTEMDIDKAYMVSEAILFLSQVLYEYYHKKVVILIDEYDTPMISAYEQGYYEEIHDFFSSLYGSALKDNPYLERAMLTGIHRIAKENIFSGLNNLDVCTVMDEQYSQYFGLMPEETETLLAYYELPLDESVQAMYDGYRFGGQEIYNPWSILNYARNKKKEPYWVNTASNELLVQAMLHADQRTKNNFEQLLARGMTMVAVDLQTSFFEMSKAATLWGLFLNSGYLTAAETQEDNEFQTAVCIPNQEVMISFRKIVERYGGFEDSSLDDLFGALQRKDIADFKAVYEQIILTCTSFHDGSGENAYHMLFLGMCVYLSNSYEIQSNVERGHGRADIVLKAKRPGRANYIFEFKQGEDIERLAKEAMEQIHEKQYYAGLSGETILLGIAHNLKHCEIVSEVR